MPFPLFDARLAAMLVAEGPADALHRGLTAARTLIEIGSGVASRARRIVTAARAGRAGIAVASTRKHLPGAKDVFLKAIAAGGCVPHRPGPSDSVLVLARHRVLLEGRPPHLWIAEIRAARPERKIAVEAETVESRG